MNINIVLLLILAIPLAYATVLPLFHKKHKARDIFSVFIAIANFMLCLYLAYLYFEKNQTAVISLVHLQGVFGFVLYTENMGVLFALLVSLLWIISVIYSVGYLSSHHEKNQTRFFAFFGLSIWCTLGVAFSFNLFTLFLFYELLTLTTFPLVAHNFNSYSKDKILTYLKILVVTSMAFFMLAIMITYYLTGSTDFTKGGIYNMISGYVNPYFIIFVLLLFIFGIAKAGLMPVHRWLPAAMVAPTPVSALLHAVAVVKTGAFAVVKVIVFIFGVDYLNSVIYTISSWNWLLIIPSFTTIVASIIAIYQDNLKRRLAYSTIAQLSYVVLGALILTPTSVLAANLHIFAHAFGKITLFFAAGSIIVLAHKEKISELNGLAHKMPIAFCAFTVGALSMIGLPLTFGFVSKWFLIIGIIESTQYWVLVVVIVSTVLNAMYFLPIIFRGFFVKNTEDAHVKVGKSRAMDIAMVITAGFVIIFGIYSSFIIDMILKI